MLKLKENALIRMRIMLNEEIRAYKKDYKEFRKNKSNNYEDIRKYLIFKHDIKRTENVIKTLTV